MNRSRLLPAALLAGAMWACGDGAAQEASSRDSGQEVYQENPPPTAEPGFTWVRVVRYKEIQHPVCKRVPDKRYRWVYDTRPDYYCLPTCPPLFSRHKDGGDDCQPCQNCKGPYYRPQLRKKQVEMNCGWKCVVEYVKEKVPVVAWRKVRIGEEEKEASKPLPTPRPVPPQPGGKPPEGGIGPTAPRQQLPPLLPVPKP